MLTQVQQHLASDTAGAVERMRSLLSIPSVSTDPAYAGHVREAAEWVAGALRDVAFDVTVHPTAGHPIVLAHSRTAHLPPGTPRVLFYGHYDVQPPDPLALWITPPFEPTIRDGAVVARGASDDKGQVCCFLEALRAWHAPGIAPGIAAGTSGANGPPVHVTVLIEGEEECGSKNLRPFLEKHRDELKADVVLISDTTMWDRDTVAITYALRGLQYFDVQLHNSNRDLHSGVYGGTLANPCTMLTRVLGRLFDDRHRVAIPGFYDDVAPLSDDERKRWSKLGFDEFAHCLKPIGVKVPFGEAGYSTLERKWSRPACDINGLFGGYGGAGAKTVIPSFAGAKVSFRLAPNQRAGKLAKQFTDWLRSHDVHGCEWKITDLGGSDPVMVATDSPYLDAAARAIEAGTGKPPVLVRDGASIPVVADFKKLLGVDSLLVGFGLTDDRIHSPNEKFDLSCFDLGCKTHAAILHEMASVRR